MARIVSKGGAAVLLSYLLMVASDRFKRLPSCFWVSPLSLRSFFKTHPKSYIPLPP